MSAPKALAISELVISPTNVSRVATFSDRTTLPSLAKILCFNSSAFISNISDGFALIKRFILNPPTD